MPKKSKRDKILAELRRIREKQDISSKPQEVYFPNPISTQTNTHGYSFKPGMNSSSNHSLTAEKMNLTDFQAIKKDLFRTLFLALTAMISVIILSYKI